MDQNEQIAGGPSSSTPTSQNSVTPRYNTPTIQAGNNIRDGDKFLVITQTSSGQTNVWASHDPKDAKQLYQSVAQSFQLQREPQTA